MDLDRKRYVIIVPDGMGDYMIPELDGKTILQKANTPNMDYLASHGIVGTVQTLPTSLPAGSDVANLSLLGFDPVRYYTGRAPLEAANIGIKLKEDDVAYRCNLVTLNNNRMEDFSAGHIPTPESSVLIKFLDNKLGKEDLHFYPGTSYRNLMVWSAGKLDPLCTPPHDIINKEYIPYLPKGPGADLLIKIMDESQRLLPGHPVNQGRVQRGQRAATSIWLWGQGLRPNLPNFFNYYKLKGGMISAVDLLKGIGIYLGLKIIDVPGITGYLDTNFAGKGECALEALQDLDIVYIHIEAPDEAGHNGDKEGKIKALEDIDCYIVGKIIQGLKIFPYHTIMIIPDHYTPISVKTHTRDPVPFCIYSSFRHFNQPTKVISFNEQEAEKSSLRFSKGHELIMFFLGLTNN